MSGTFAPLPDDEELYAFVNRGLALYARGEYFEAHELWEDAWNGEVGRTKLMLQALIQIAAALHKHHGGVPAGACKLLAKAEAKLGEVRAGASAWLGIDVVALSAEVTRALAEADRVAAGEPIAIRPPALPPVTGPDGVIYFHGFASSPRSKKAGIIARALADSGLAVAVPDLNLPDFEGLTISRALAAARRHLRDRTLVIGSSFGGYLAALLAARDERVRAVVLLAPAFDFARRLGERLGVEAWRERGFTMVEHHATKQPERLGFGIIEDAAAYPAFPRLRVPTYVLHGVRDDVAPVELSRSFRALHPRGVHLEEVDDGHELYDSAPRALEAARRFAEKLALRPDLSS